MKIQENVALAPMTTIGVGGPALYFADAQTEEEVREAIEFARDRALPLFILGGGSNLLIADAGWPGLVLKVNIQGLSITSHGRSRVFDSGAGIEWDDLVAKAVAENCAGIECLSGIPGSVGGTPVQNVGAYGQEVSETIQSVRAWDLKESRAITLSNQECQFRYRESIFNRAERGRYIILRVAYQLTIDGAPTIKYEDLTRYFGGRQPSLAEVRVAVNRIRLSKGMLIMPGDPDCRSAGSFFKNPVLSAPKFEELSKRAGERGLKIPSYPGLAQHKKVSAAWLVEHSGFKKGYQLENAAISQKHSLALVNRGNASAENIVRLKEQIQECVQQNWGILLETEPVLVGF
jgi:UDP-N-acetylmuramate dehydrogenase